MLSANAILGYQYQEGLTGEKAEDMQARFLEEHGITFYHDMLRAKKQAVYEQIKDLDITEVAVAVAPLIAAKVALTEKVEEKI